jgi:Threonine synthase
VRYISTRGEAPALGFVEATLAGLARDGGLYVPAAWPRLDADTIAGFAGRPYAEVAVEVIRPFVGGAIPECDLARMTREAYGRFRHPAVAPLMQFGASDFLLELFHGPTLAFKDLAMQLLGRLVDEALATRESARPSWSQLPETPAGPRSRPFAVACARTCSCFFRRAAFPMCNGG